MRFAVRFIALLILFASSTTSIGVAQGVQLAGFQQPPPVTQPDQITAELIEAKRKEAADSTELLEEAKKKCDDHYKVALDGIKKVVDQTAIATRYKQDTDDVQERVRRLKNRLTELQTYKPTTPSFPTLPELEQERSKRDFALNELKAALAKAEAEPTTRANRRKDIRAVLLSATQRITDIDKLLATPAPGDEPMLQTQARQTELRVRRLLIEAELPALQNELSKYDAEDAADFVRLDRDVRTQEVAAAVLELKLFDEAVDRQRAEENSTALQRARDQAIAAQPLLQIDANLNADLAKKAVENAVPINDAKAKLEAVKTRLDGIQKQFTTTQQKVENIGLSGAIGALLRRQKSDLPNVTRRHANIDARRKVIEDVQYNLFEYDDQRAQLANRDPHVKAIRDSAPSQMSVVDRKKLEEAARDLFDRRADYLDQLIRSYNTQLDTLFELDQTEQLLIAATERYTNYIDERVLWIRSNDPLFTKIGIDTTDGWVVDSARWMEFGEKLFTDMRDNLSLHATVLLIVSALVLLKPRIRRELELVGALARKGNCTRFAPTLRAAWLTVLMSTVWPGLAWFVAWRMSQAANGSDFVRAVSFGLYAVAWSYLPLDLLRKVCRVGGLADHHFDWPDSTIRLFRRTLPSLECFGLPLVFVTTTLYTSDLEHGLDLLERIFFVLATIVLAIFLRRFLRPDTGILCEYLTAHPDGWFARTKWLWYWGSVVAPLCLAVLTIAGFYFTAQQLSWRLFATIVFVLSLQLVRAMLQRLIIVQRRKLSIDHAKKRRAEQAAQQIAAAQAAAAQALASAAQGSDAGTLTSSGTKAAGTQSSSGISQLMGPSAIVPPEVLRADVEATTEQSRRLLGIAVMAASLVGGWMIWVDVLPALRMFDQWQLWTTTVEVSAEEAGLKSTSTSSDRGLLPSSALGPGAMAGAAQPEIVTVVRPVTPRHVALALLIAVITIACARNIPGLMEMWVLQRLPLDQSVRYAITTMASYTIVLLGVILSFGAISVGWAKVQWLATALTFGLAFGLQEIFANFVAGLILLFERPIRIGDVVTVDDVSGVVSRIRIRATTITNWDRKEFVIPNKEFITGRMLNWTLTDKVNRLVINVGVAYGSNVEQAKQLLLQICRDHPLIMTDPGPVATLEGFGDNSLNFVIRTYLPNLDNRLAVIDALHTNIERTLREAGIEIAFPQRDLHLRSIDSSITDALRGTPRQPSSAAGT